MALALLSALAAALITNRALASLRRPAYESYSTENSAGFKWRWHYSGGEPILLTAHCPSCDAELMASEFVPELWETGSPETAFHCPVCPFNNKVVGITRANLERGVQAKIRARIRQLGGNPSPIG